MIGLTVLVGGQITDAQLYDEIKTALDEIDAKSADILEQWVVVGERLRELHKRNPERSGTFRAAVRREGIDLSADQISAAQWWAALTPDRRQTLCREHPDVLMPTSMQVYCRENHPEWARNRGSDVSKSFGNQRNSEKRQNVLPIEQNQPAQDAKNKVKLTKSQRADIQRQLKEDELTAAREKRRLRLEAEEQRRAGDQRPALSPKPVVMYGEQLWPVPVGEVAHYDYDQLFFAIHFFNATLVLVRHHYGDQDIGSLAQRLRERVKPLYLFSTRRLTDHDRTEMIHFIEVVQKLADLFGKNPSGECQIPFDMVMQSGF